jgi:hypothetical protein
VIDGERAGKAMIQKSASKTIIILGSIALLLLLTSASIIWVRYRVVSVNDLWKIEYNRRNLEGKVVNVRGDIIFEPNSDFRFNNVFLIDSSTSVDLRMPEDGFWFGIGIGDVSCIRDKVAMSITCEPFDPGQAMSYQFRGVVHLEQIGKKEIMWLSDIDFSHSRQLVDGKWQVIPIGEFIIPLKNE